MIEVLVVVSPLAILWQWPLEMPWLWPSQLEILWQLPSQLEMLSACE